MNRPLEKIRILDLTQVIAGSYGAMILADLGAEVIKIEPPTGDIIRDGAGHRIGGERVGYLSFNRNKKSVVLDLKKGKGGKSSWNWSGRQMWSLIISGPESWRG